MDVIQLVFMGKIEFEGIKINTPSRIYLFLHQDFNARRHIGDGCFQKASTRRNLLIENFMLVIFPIILAKGDLSDLGK